MMLMLVFLLSSVPAFKACLQCDRRIRLLHEDFVLSAPTVDDQIEMKKICDHAYVTYKETSWQRKGVIDPTTLYRARTEYQSEFDRFLKTQLTGSVTFDTIQIMEKGRKILEKHLDIFIRDGLCPNKCGVLKRRVMSCFSCKYKIHICSSGQQDCGDYPVQAEEGGQAVLNCFLPWHRLLMGRPEYHYSWAPGAPGTKKLIESDFKVLVVTDDSSVVLNQLHVNEQGTYRCSLRGQNGTIFYRITFLLTGGYLAKSCENPCTKFIWGKLTVAPLPNQTHSSVITLPPLPHGDNYSPFQPTESLLVPLLVMVTALSLAASAGLTLVLGLMINQRRGVEEVRRRRKGRATTQNTV